MGIASLTSSGIMARAKEIGLMRALGAKPWQIALLYYAEAILVGAFGGLTGCMGGAVLGWGIGQALFGATLGFTWIVVPVVVCAAILIALTGTWFPVRSIARQVPIEVLYER